MRRTMRGLSSMRSFMRRTGNAGAWGFPRAHGRRRPKPLRSWQSQSSAKGKGKAGKTNWVFWLVAVIIGLNILGTVLSSLFDYFLYW